MKNKKLNTELVWKQFEDLVVPQLKLSTVDHAVYSYLLRHSHLEGKRRLHLSMHKLGRGTHLSSAGARRAVRRMVEKGALRLVERSKAGHVIEVRLPEEIRRVRAKMAKECASRGLDLERVSFWRDKGLRAAIHRREGGRCFYCLRRVKARLRCIDHVVPQVRCGPNSYRNLVSSCVDCNAEKQEEEAGNFLRKLYREERLTLEELNGRLRALKDLAAGRMRPEVKVREVKEVQEIKEKEETDSSGLKA
ncbi:MAG TPA: HNH endonuclease signature motif containing protein [Methylomirabilota bacterium]|nr:HNH endonuclease signature motif containing protein [Methylomirabilota bacterium]